MIDIFIPTKLIDTQSQLLNALSGESEVLQEVTDNFTPLMKNFRVFFFWEQEKTDWGYKWDYVVTENSAAPILDDTDRAGLRAGHRDMCRFASRNSPDYKMVVSSIVRYSRDAPQSISRRWALEKQRVQSMRQHELDMLNEEDEREPIPTKKEQFHSKSE
ncbi:hypothetical protein GGS20DRAFT_391745 [Poronia punctata]|nr:hypothetical protein GGS20DRAFT_391745 [Poronia punctata]